MNADRDNTALILIAALIQTMYPYPHPQHSLLPYRYRPDNGSTVHPVWPQTSEMLTKQTTPPLKSTSPKCWVFFCVCSMGFLTSHSQPSSQIIFWAQQPVLFSAAAKRAFNIWICACCSSTIVSNCATCKGVGNWNVKQKVGDSLDVRLVYIHKTWPSRRQTRCFWINLPCPHLQLHWFHWFHCQLDLEFDSFHQSHEASCHGSRFRHHWY